MRGQTGGAGVGVSQGPGDEGGHLLAAHGPVGLERAVGVAGGDAQLEGGADGAVDVGWLGQVRVREVVDRQVVVGVVIGILGWIGDLIEAVVVPFHRVGGHNREVDEEQRHLGPGQGGVRIEGRVGAAGHDARVHQTVDGGLPVGTEIAYVGEAHAGTVIELHVSHAGHPDQEQRNLRAGHVVVGHVEGRCPARGDPVVGDAVDVVGTEAADIGEAGVGQGGTDTRRPSGEGSRLPCWIDRRGGCRCAPGREERGDDGARGQHCGSTASGGWGSPGGHWQRTGRGSRHRVFRTVDLGEHG